jgi:hypothetical protein
MEKAIQALRREGKDEAADLFQAALDEMSPEDKARRKRREASHWRTVWLEPSKQTPGDVYFLLGLILLQEDMIPGAKKEMEDQALAYLAKKLVVLQAAGRLRRLGGTHDKTDLAQTLVGRVLTALLGNFTEPEGWRAADAYIKLVVKGAVAEDTTGLGSGGNLDSELEQVCIDGGWRPVSVLRQDDCIPTVIQRRRSERRYAVRLDTCWEGQRATKTWTMVAGC